MPFLRFTWPLLHTQKFDPAIDVGDAQDRARRYSADLSAALQHPEFWPQQTMSFIEFHNSVGLVAAGDSAVMQFAYDSLALCKRRNG